MRGHDDVARAARAWPRAVLHAAASRCPVTRVSSWSGPRSAAASPSRYFTGWNSAWSSKRTAPATGNGQVELLHVRRRQPELARQLRLLAQLVQVGRRPPRRCSSACGAGRSRSPARPPARTRARCPPRSPRRSARAVAAEALRELRVGEPVKRAELRGGVAGGPGADVAHLEHRDVQALALEQQRGREPDDPGAHHHHVDLDVAVERRTRGRRRGLRARVSAARRRSYPVFRPGTPGHETSCRETEGRLSACLLALALAGCGAGDGSRMRPRSRSASTPPRGRRRPGGLRRAERGDRVEARAAGEEAVRGGDPRARAAEGRHGRGYGACT